jgi:Transcriptional regulators
MNEDFQINMNEYLPLRDVVFNTLRQAILKGELKPGERLMEIQLANRLGVSRTPIREAIRKLELEGLVLMIPRKGAEVAQITIKNLQDVLQVRAALEQLAVQIVCQNMKEERIVALKKANKEFEKAIKQGSLTAITDADVEFHEIIYQATNNTRLINILNNLREQMYRYRVEYLKDRNSHVKLVEEHEVIIAQLANRDEAGAVKTILTHIENQTRTVMKHLAEKK